MVEPIKITKAPLSEKWRVASSKLQPLDLAAIQKSLSTVAGQLSGGRLKSFKFGTDTYADSKGNIVYDVTEILDMPSPLPAEQVDIMLGKTVHESGHVKVASAWTRHLNMTDSNAGHGTPLSYRELNALGEEVYTDNYVYRNMGEVASEYLIRARAASVGAETPKGIHNILLAQHIYSVQPTAESISELQDTERTIYWIASTMLAKLVAGDLTVAARMDLYNETWAVIAQLISSLVQQKEIADSMANEAFGFPQDGPIKSRAQTTKENVEKAREALGIKPQEDVQEPIDAGLGFGKERLFEREERELRQTLDELGRPKRGRRRNSKKAQAEKDVVRQKLNDLMIAKTNEADSPEAKRKQELVSAIQDAVESESEDLSSVIESYQLQEFGASQSMTVVYSKALVNSPEYKDFDTTLYKKLVSLKNLKNTIGKETLRGEDRGQIDRHNLYRAGIDGKAFKQIRVKPRKDIKIVCLLDASGSMRGNTDIYKAAHALSKVIKGTEILSYRGSGDNCSIVRQTSGQGFKQIQVDGGTPSGQALLATAKKFPDRMIIHFTDGDSNEGFTTAQAFTIMQKKFPKVKVIDVQMGRQGYFRSVDEFPNVVRVRIGNVQEFPAVLQEAIKPWVRGGG